MDQTINDEVATKTIRKVGNRVISELKITTSGLEMMSLKTGWKHGYRCLQTGKIDSSALRKHHS